MTPPKDDEEPGNFTHLLSHLKENTLAARLAAAYAEAPVGNGDAALKELVKERIREIAKTYDAADHQED